MTNHRHAFAIGVCLVFTCCNCHAESEVREGDVVVVVNESDPLSVAIGDYYVRRRGLPVGNVVTVRFDPAAASVTRADFEREYTRVLAQTPSEAQFYVLTWLRPYRVECMSVTSAFAFGFAEVYCANGCERTRLSPYFGSDSARPWTELHVRPTMSLAATSFAQARALIDRGIASDAVQPDGTAYLAMGGDAARDVRAGSYSDARRLVGERIRVRLVAGRDMVGQDDVMFYFTGGVQVPALDSNVFLPGAVGDHLTSAGGVLDGAAQMSSLRWLEAGATGSYGTVIEPCNFTAKFPNPALLMQRYLAGETLIEAYWKSVAMPGQGLFIGEPLARPFGRSTP